MKTIEAIRTTTDEITAMALLTAGIDEVLVSLGLRKPDAWMDKTNTDALTKVVKEIFEREISPEMEEQIHVMEIVTEMAKSGMDIDFLKEMFLR